MATGSELASAWVSIYPKFARNFNSTVAKTVNNALGGLSGSMSKTGASLGRKLGDGIASGVSTAKIAVGNALASGVTAALGQVTQSLDGAIARTDTMANFPRVMSSWGESTEHANATIDKLVAGIDGLPTKTNDITANVQRLYTTLGDLDKASSLGLGLNDMMLSNSASTELANNAFEQFTQMLAAGRVDMQAWKSVVNAAPKAVDTLAKSLLGAEANATDLYNALPGSQGYSAAPIKLSFEQLTDAIIDLDQNGADGLASFAEQAREASKGIATSMQNVKTAIEKNIANVFQAIGQERIAGYFDTIKGQVNEFGAWFLTTKVPHIVDFLDRFDFEGAINAVKRRITSTINWLNENIVPPVKQVFGSLQSLVGSVSKTLGANSGGFAGLFSKMFGGAADVFSATVPIITNVLNVIIDKMGQVSNFIVSNWDTISGKVGPVVTSIKESIEGAVKGIGEAFKGYDGAGLLWNIIDGVGAFATRTVELLSDLAVNAAQFIASLDLQDVNFAGGINKFFDIIEGGIAFIKSDVLPVFSEIGRSAEPVFKLIGDSLRDMFNNSEFMSSVQDRLSTAVQIFGQVIKGTFEFIQNNWDTLSNLFGSLASILSKVFDAAAGFISEHGDLIYNFFEKLLDVGAKLFDFVDKNFDTLMPILLGIIGLTKVALPLVSTLSGAVSSGAGMLEGLGGLLSAEGGAAAAGGGSGILGLLTGGAGEGITSAITALKGIPAVIGQIASKLALPLAIITAIATLVHQWWTDSEGFREAVGRIGEAIMGVVEHVRKPFEPLFDKIGALFDNLANTTIPKIANALEPVGTFLANAIAFILDAIGIIAEIVGWIVSGPLQLLVDIISAVATGLGMVADFIGAIINKVAEFLKPLTDPIGQFLGETLGPKENAYAALDKHLAEINAQENRAAANVNAYDQSEQGASDAYEEIRKAVQDGMSGTTFNIDGRKIADAVQDDTDRVAGSAYIYTQRGLS